ncbi:MAG: cell division protein BolA [Porticoccus sp.]|jgi:acid stress-induced BolA-like protein IbaG/YrbA|nr:cell division protein BolA [Porticoccus sp.]|tara:strand:+ start:412 stop:648 length:237 start_codon:yes stop_codon:yes gene_type:complete
MESSVRLEINKLLEKQFPNCKIKVEGDNGHYGIDITGEIFSGLNSVKRQQSVYQVINDYIKNGTIHAVIIKACTPDEI